MFAVSHGARQFKQGIGVQKGLATHSVSQSSTSRSLHISSFVPRARAPPSVSTTQRVFNESRTLLSRFFAHLTAPGLAHSSVSPSASQTLARPLHSHASSITSNLSFPVRHALSKPLSAPRLPRPPALPNSVAHVGLGSARSFHSARPIFQNLVDNVPVATRALWEAEWDIKTKKELKRRFRKKENQRMKKSGEMIKPKTKEEPFTFSISETAEELEHYFAAPQSAQVTTHLLVPLAPTPTFRLPLSAHSGSPIDITHPLLPIADVATTHHLHRTHSLRVSSLFARLDAANVWDDPGVGVDAYAYGPRDYYDESTEKQCTILRVTFAGWTADRVRSVIGESGTGWCALEETRPTEHPSSPLLSPSLSSMDLESEAEIRPESAYGVGLTPTPHNEEVAPDMDSEAVSDSFVLPTLDFSSSFASRASPPAPQPEIILRTASELALEYSWSQSSSGLSSPTLSLSSVSSVESLSDVGFPFPPVAAAGTSSSDASASWMSLGLSSQFSARVGEESYLF
ncbi:hypothetical protein BV22DRAFT_1031032 [Leucogyrophana mollusca]|uniref:Uncharacterized protein n=1 Tax=Leucogyrophana mollusca TaxID=85980 RepID=A0ACB8BRP7_9AGAM|nr:hypothetical protein BV22DRAFT_1031032 [Leucogyrophana mollusca]